LLVPLLPFAMLAVAALLARGNPAVIGVATMLAVWGGVLILLFQGAGGQVPQFVGDPLREAVLPCWTGEPLPEWRANGRFTRNLVSVIWPGRVASLQPPSQWLQFVPLLLEQAGAIALLMLTRRSSAAETPARESAVAPSTPVPK
jgi:hypothetical protein